MSTSLEMHSDRQYYKDIENHLRIDENEASSCLCIDCWRSSSRFLIHVLIIGIIIYFCSLYIYNRFPGCWPPFFLYLIMYNIVSYRRQQQQYRENIRKRAIKGGRTSSSQTLLYIKYNRYIIYSNWWIFFGYCAIMYRLSLLYRNTLDTMYRKRLVQFVFIIIK